MEQTNKGKQADITYRSLDKEWYMVLILRKTCDLKYSYYQNTLLQEYTKINFSDDYFYFAPLKLIICLVSKHNLCESACLYLKQGVKGPPWEMPLPRHKYLVNQYC